MTELPSSQGMRWTALSFLTAVYYLAAKFGLMLAFVHASATAIWPCTGLALTAVLILGSWVWPAIFLGAFLANVTTAGTIMTSLGIATGNTLEAVVGGWLVARFAGGVRAFESPGQIVAYTGITSLFSTPISATIGLVSLCLGGAAAWPQFPTIWMTWWIGDMISDLVVAPFLILWITNPRIRWVPMQVYEATLLMALLVYVGQCVFAGWMPTAYKHYPLEFACLPLLVWTAFRFGQRETATTTLVLAAIALSGTLQGSGPFALTKANESLLLLQAYLGVASVMALTVAATVAERTRVAAALRDSEAQSRAILDTTVDAVITIDERGTVLSFNPAAERMFGYARTEVLGRNVNMLMASPHQERHDTYLRNYLHTGDAKIIGTSREEMGQRKDGSVFDVDLTISEVWFGPRRIFTGIIRDITERRHAEQERGRLAAIVQSSSDAIVGADLDGTIRTWNEGAERVFGYRADEVIGRTSDFLTPPEQLHEIAEVLAKIQAGERVDNLETVRTTKDGRAINLSIMISPVRDKSGVVVGVSAIARDVTAQKRTEQRLMKLTENLERSNKDLEHFAYIASHDLHEPLRKIRSFTELLARRYKGQLDADADTFIGYIVDGATRLQQLIDDLLAYSRVGRGEIPMTAVPVGKVIQGVLGVLESQVQESGARVTVGELPIVHANETLLAQIFQNLISNATKFRSKDPLHITIAAERGEGLWRFSVADNGIGIDPGAHDRVFQIFQRLHTRREYSGTGIGLAVCKRIAERHRGTIWIDSEPGRGSTFFFTIPDQDSAPFAVV